jgi:hypothetical protein
MDYAALKNATEKCEHAHNNDFLLDAIWSKSSALITVAMPVVGMSSFALFLTRIYCTVI